METFMKIAAMEEAQEIMHKAALANSKSVDDFQTTSSVLRDASGMIEKIDSFATQNARSAEEIASAAEHLSHLTDTLNEKLSSFKTA